LQAGLASIAGAFSSIVVVTIFRIVYFPPINMLWCTTIMIEDPNIILVRSFFTAFGEGRPTDVRSALETFLSELCCYGERFKNRGAVLR
jgi:hypothetical protein